MVPLLRTALLLVVGRAAAVGSSSSSSGSLRRAAGAAQHMSTTAAAASSSGSSPSRERAVLGGGCFWCLEAVFQPLDGVLAVVPGYAGGPEADPTYELVSSGRTGHAEVVEVAFDNSTLSFEQLLHVFMHAHDPTQYHRQGWDIGPQYRSIILFDGEQQKATAKRVLEEVQKTLTGAVVTELVPLQRFYPAEQYHHNYFASHPEQAYCRTVIAPKVQRVENRFQHLLRPPADGDPRKLRP